MDFNQYADSYSDRVDDAIAFSGLHHDFFLKAKADQLLEVLGRAGDPGRMTILDVGSGVGLMEAHLAGSVKRVVGVDLAADAVCSAKSIGGAAFLVYDGSRLPFADGAFDAVFAVCVLHHVDPPQWGSFTAEMARVTRPGGMVVVFEHNPWNPATRVVVSRCEFDRGVTLLSAPLVARLLRAATGEAPARRFLFFFPWQGRSWRALERFLGWLPMGAQYVAHARKRNRPPRGVGG